MTYVHDGHGTGSHRLCRLLDLDQTHSAVTGDGETVVVTEARDLDSNHGGGLR